MGNLRKGGGEEGGVDLEKGDINPLTNYAFVEGPKCKYKLL